MGMNNRLLRPRQTDKYKSLRADLLAYWPFGEVASSGDVTAEDWTGRGNNLTSNNSVLSVAGKAGNARQFVRANSEWLSGSSSDYALGEAAYTVAFWFLVPQNATNSFFILTAKDENNARQFAINYNSTTAGVNTSNALTVTIYSSGQGGLNGGFTGLSRDQWHLLAITHNASSSSVLLTLDNTSTATISRTGGSWATFSTPLNIGRRAFTGFNEYAEASVDEFAIWGRSLTAAELSTLWNNGAGIDLRK